MHFVLHLTFNLSQMAVSIDVGSGGRWDDVYSIPALFRLLIMFANSLYPDQVRKNVGLDLDPNSLNSDGTSEFFF